MALVIQSNLARLRDRDAQGTGVDPSQHDIRVPHLEPHRLFEFPPRTMLEGARAEFRQSETKPSAHGPPRGIEGWIDDETLAAYTAAETHLRLHEVWGQFCVMCWFFGVSRDAAHADLAKLDLDVDLPCETSLQAKHAEVHALSWRIAFEQRRRSDRAYVESIAFAEDQTMAERIPAMALGIPAGRATDGQLLLAACEHAGMLATLRWIMDARRAWDEPGIMDLDDHPF